jgi:SAM-dependent methyltransferase
MSNVSSTLARVVGRFNEKFGEFGPSAKGLDYNSDEAQSLRFEQLEKLLPKETHFSLLDYGCGYGALVGFLRERGYDFNYTGFDLSEQLIAHAKEVYAGQNDVQFTSTVTELQPADYCIACGVFNIKLDMAVDQWSDYFYGELARLAGLSKRGFAFNTLTAYSDADRMREDLYYPDPRDIFDYCVRNISRHVAVLHDYQLYDCTFLVRFYE